MKISKGRLREIIKEVIKEESDYQTFFKKSLEKSGKSLGDMTDQEKKDFFNKIDKSWKGKGEKNEGNSFGAAVTKAKEQGKDSFEVGGKTYKVKESVVNERKYGDQTGTKGALLQDKEFSKLISSKERKFIQGNDVKIYKSDAGMIQHFTDGKMEMVVNTKRPMSIVKNLGKASNEIKKVYQQKNESVVNEQSSNRDIKALSYMTGVPDYKIEAFLKRHRLKDLKKVKKLVKGMGIKKDEKFAKMVDGNFSLETEFRRMYKDL